MRVSYLDQRQSESFAALEARDADTTAALFADEAVVHVANMPPIEGRSAIREFYGLQATVQRRVLHSAPPSRSSVSTPLRAMHPLAVPARASSPGCRVPCPMGGPSWC